jgi:phosphate transport system substrate-binding protein
VTREPAIAPIDPIELGKARKRGINARGPKKFYDQKFDLSGIPEYVPAREVTGRIRQWGNHYFGLSGLMDVWEAGFRHHHPRANFADNLASSAVAFPGLIAGQADLAPIGRQALWTELKGAERQNEHEGEEGRVPLEITVCTGSYNVSGWTFAFAIFVNERNPIEELTVEQLDGIFGAERNGGWKGLAWDAGPDMVRGPEKNIRTWGQLGLTGEWADKPIRVHAYNLSFHFPDEFDKKVLKNSQKWNESMTTYANVFGLKADGTMTNAGEQMATAVGSDPYAITYTGILHANVGTKAVALAPRAGVPAVPLTIENVQNRTYPLIRDVFYYMNIKEADGVPKVNPDGAEFLRYLLSREGQAAIQEHDCKYLPLTADEARRQLRKLEEYLD